VQLLGKAQAMENGNYQKKSDQSFHGKSSTLERKMLKLDTLISPQLKPHLTSMSSAKSTALAHLEQHLTFLELGK
jgi:hypothetical protein